MSQTSRSDRGLLTATPTDCRMGVQSKAGYTVLDESRLEPGNETPEQEFHLHASATQARQESWNRLRVPDFQASRLCPLLKEDVKQTLLKLAIVFSLALGCGMLGGVLSHLLINPTQCQGEHLHEQTVAEITRQIETKFNLHGVAQIQTRMTGLETRLQNLEKSRGEANDAQIHTKDQLPQTDSAKETLEGRLHTLEQRLQSLQQSSENDDYEDEIIDVNKDEGERLLQTALGYRPQDQSKDDSVTHSQEGDPVVEGQGQGHRSRRSASVNNKAANKQNGNGNGNGKGNGKGNGNRKGNGNGNGKAIKCDKVQSCLSEINEAKHSKKCKDILKCVPAPPVSPFVQQFVPKAVHFMSDFWNDNIRKERFGKEQALKFLKPADWMAKMYNSPDEQPIVQVDGSFKVKQPGLYLIYSSVLFHDNKPRQSQAVVVNGYKLFKCMDSVDYIDTDLPAGSNQAKYKTCAMTGVTHLKAGDLLEVQNLYPNTEIDLTTDATYFGAVLLNAGEIKSGAN